VTAPKAKARHLPGPWFADCDRDSEGHFRASIMDEGLRVEIALVTQDLDHTRDDGTIVARIKPAVAQANADLIAAAPDLLAACEYALNFTVANGDAHNRLRAAIGKAVRS